MGSAANKFTTCQFVLEKCPFASPTLASTCVQNFCLGEPYGFGSCTSDFTGTPADCCGQSDPASCIAAFQQTQGYANSNDACLQIEYIAAACSQANPGFGSLTLQEQAQCLCYDNSGNFDPTSWDNAASSCVATGAQAHPTVYSQLEAHNGAAVGLCTNVAGAAASSAPAAAASSTPPSAGTTTQQVAGLTATGEASSSNVVASISSESSSGAAQSATTTSASTPSASASSSTSTKSSSGREKMGYLEMKWMAAGLGLLLSGTIIGAL